MYEARHSRSGLLHLRSTTRHSAIIGAPSWASSEGTAHSKDFSELLTRGVCWTSSVTTPRHIYDFERHSLAQTPATRIFYAPSPKTKAFLVKFYFTEPIEFHTREALKKISSYHCGITLETRKKNPSGEPSATALLLAYTVGWNPVFLRFAIIRHIYLLLVFVLYLGHGTVHRVQRLFSFFFSHESRCFGEVFVEREKALAKKSEHYYQSLQSV